MPEMPSLLTAIILGSALQLCGCGKSPSSPGVAPVSVPEDFSREVSVQRLVEGKFEAAAADPGNPVRHRTLGLALAANEGWELAETSFRNALELDSDDHESRFQLAAALKNRGDLDGQVQELRAIVTKDPTFYAAHYALGCALLDGGELDEAAAMFRTVEAGEGAKGLGELGLGLIALERDEPEQALARLTAAAKSYPEDNFIRFQIGQTYLALGKEEQAKQILSGVQDVGGRPALRSPGSAELKRYAMSRSSQMARALEMIKRDQHAQAIPILEGLAESDPSDTAAANNLHVAYKGVGRLDDALRIIDDAIAKAPDQHAAYLNRASCLLRRAEVKRKAGRIPESRDELALALLSSEQAVERAPRLGKARLMQGQILSALRRDAESIQAFRKGIELGETQASTYIDMNVPVLRSGGVAASEALLREALQYPDVRPRIRFELCGVLLSTGRGAEARAEQRKLARLAPGDPFAVRADKILTKQGY